MKRFLPALAATVALGTATPAPAFDLGLGLFKKKPAGPSAATPAKADTSTKVKQLVATLQSDTDIDRRKAATEALKSHDPRNNPDVIPALIASLQKDPSPAVRALAAEAIGSYKSLYAAAAVALDASEKGDPDQAVRAAAKNSLWQYHLNGYKPTTAAPGTTQQSSEPPLAASRPVAVAVAPVAPSVTAPAAPDFRPITQGPGAGRTFQPTAEPPLAKPKASLAVPPAAVPDAPASRVEPPASVGVPMPAIPTGPAVTSVVPPPPAK